jgi:CxxC-x17-CxxC domain-containing protein
MASQANCSNCGEGFTLPFEPDPNRPVYCKKCMVFDASEAFQLGKSDFEEGEGRVNKGRCHKSVKSDYDSGWNQSSRDERDEFYASEKRAERDINRRLRNMGIRH